MKKIFPILLFLISMTVAFGLFFKKNMWPWIALYWTVLTVKNGFDL